ncbi:MAG: hypothetical protein Q4B71_01935 [Cardiobacteriaceae bacterium]|nr:hypothetical protein [Cardiobacteriaceae bacterium]
MRYALLLTALLSSQLYAQTRSVDPTEFDVAGIKLGMSRDEAIQALAKSQEVDTGEIQLQTYPPKNKITGETEPHSFELKKDHTNIIVTLTPVPEAGGKLAVSRISYNIAYTEENVKALEEAVLAKYGKPSYGGIGGWRYCKEIDEKELMKCKNIYTDPQLIYNHTTLTLQDPRLESALEAWEKAQKATKPKL